jgi:hypothetical protein
MVVVPQLTRALCCGEGVSCKARTLTGALCHIPESIPPSADLCAAAATAAATATAQQDISVLVSDAWQKPLHAVHVRHNRHRASVLGGSRSTASMQDAMVLATHLHCGDTAGVTTQQAEYSICIPDCKQFCIQYDV